MQIPPRDRIVVAVDVVREPGLRVVVLAGEAQGVAADRVDEDAAVEGGELGAPDRGAGLVGDEFRPPEMVGVDPVQGVVADQRDGFAVEVEVMGAAACLGVVLVQGLAVESVDEAGRLSVDRLGHAHAGGGDPIAEVEHGRHGALETVGEEDATAE